MIPNCYFCHKPLEKFRDSNETGNYTHHYSCYNCPDVDGMRDIWKRSCVVIMDVDKVSMTYLYLPNIALWITVYYWDNRNFTNIEDKNGTYILQVQTAPEVFNIPLEVLENKVKTWILFS